MKIAFAGVVSVESLEKALHEKAGIEAAILTDIEPIQGDTSLNEVISTVAQAPCAVPVINEKNRYLGVISKGMLLQALDKETPNE